MVKKKLGNARESELIVLCRKYLRKQLQPWPSGNLRCSSGSSDSHQQHLWKLVKRTVETGESNSVLLLGPRGSGKSMLLENVLFELEETPMLQENAAVVRLNGLLQTDDRLALKEIARQLRLENTIGDKVFGSFAETLQFLLQSLKSGQKTSKSIIFILDEFDLLCYHRNQTLLYNLFDVAQSAQAPICVIGVSCRLDVIELLEKRVKSRFSHRQIHVFPPEEFQDYIDSFVRLLSLPSEFQEPYFVKHWNAHIKQLSQNPTVQGVLKRLFDMNKDIRALKAHLLIPVCKLSDDHPELEPEDFTQSQQMQTVDSKEAVLQGLSVLELCLLIAMKHLNTNYEGEPFNFQMVFREYLKFVHRRSSMQSFDQSVAMKAFEHLQSLELIRPAEGSAASRVQKEYQLHSLVVTPQQLTGVLHKYQGLPTDVSHWAMSSLG